MAARKARSPQLSHTTWCFCWKEGNYRFQVQPGRHRQELQLKESIVVVVTKSCLTFCNPVACNTPGFPDIHHLPELAQTHVHWVGDTIQPSISSSVVPFSFYLQSFPASGSFPINQLFSSGGQSIGALASVLQMNIQGWSLLGLTGLISLPAKGLARVFSNTTVRKHQFFGTQPSLWSNSHSRTWLLEKP